MASRTVFQGSELTALYAVATGHAARVVHGVVLEVYARCLAVLGAQRAVLALALVEVDLQPRELGKDAEHSTYGADGVAVGAPVAPCQQGQYHQHHDGNAQRDAGAQPDVAVVEGVAVVVLGDGCQHVVACLIDGLQQVGGDEPERRVGGQQLYEGACAKYQQNEEPREHSSS